MGREFGLDALARLSDRHAARPTRRGDGGARRQRRAGIARAACASRHALIRDTLYDELTGRGGRDCIGGAARRSRRSTPGSRTPPGRAGAPFLRGGARRRRRTRRSNTHGAPASGRLAARLRGRRPASSELALTLSTREPADTTRCQLLLALGRHARQSRRHACLQGRFPRGRRARPSATTCPSTSRCAALGYGGRITWGLKGRRAAALAPRARARRAWTRATAELRVRLLARLAGGPLRDPASRLSAGLPSARRRSRWRAAWTTPRRWRTRSTGVHPRSPVTRVHSPAAGIGRRADRRPRARARRLTNGPGGTRGDACDALLELGEGERRRGPSWRPWHVLARSRCDSPSQDWLGHRVPRTLRTPRG